VAAQAVPNNQQLAGQMLQQVAEELDHLRTTNRAGEIGENKSSTTSPRHCRERLPVEVILLYRRLSLRCPGPAAMRPLAQPAFFDEKDHSLLVVGSS
jgi:hypothetical protein